MYVTPGKRSPKWEGQPQLFEGVNNRQIMQRVADKLHEKGIKHLFTVLPTDWHDVDLDERVAIANAYQREFKTFGVSIHSNGVRNQTVRGYEVFTSPGQTQADKVATIWAEEMKKSFLNLRPRPDNSDGDFDKEAKFAILRKTSAPWILVENEFHTNKEAAELLMSEAGQEEFANVIVRTIERVINEL